MSDSLQISLSDIRAIARLLSECREVGDDPLGWRLHFYVTLGNLVGAEWIIGGEMSGYKLDAVHLPGNAANVGQFLVENPLLSQIGRDQIKSLHAADRQNIFLVKEPGLAQGQWVRCYDDQRLAQTIKTAVCLHSLQPTSKADYWDMLSLCRPASEPRFNQREAVLVALLHGEVARLVGGPLAEPCEATPSQLSQRVRQVLNCMLQGDSDKEIAARLNLSPHTINQHTKRIYLHFQVKSRGELLARWIRRTWKAENVSGTELC